MRPSHATGAAAIVVLALAATGFTAQEPAGRTVGSKVGEPITLTVGYQPYYTEAWSGLVMRQKGFWKKYLPKGSQVNWEVGLQGSIIVGQMLAGKENIGYLGDMPAIVGASKRQIRDLRIVATLGVAQDQCGVFLVRPDAPAFRTAADAVRWLNGKTVAVPQGSCSDRVAQATFQRIGIKPGSYLNQPIDVITTSFQNHNLDGAIVWEPTASHLVDAGLARRVASGTLATQTDSGVRVMSEDLLAQRPDVAEAWLKAELDAQRYLSNPKNANAIVQMALDQTDGLTRQELWDSLYRQWPAAKGGSPNGRRLLFPFALTADVKQHIVNATRFLHSIHSIESDTLPDGAVGGSLAARVLRNAGITGPVGTIRALPRSSGTSG
jgi:NitT/TauT family transport system substrate-binding protein